MKNKVKIEKTIPPFNKIINVPSDKSISIRCVLFSAIANGKSKIYNLLESEDVMNAVRAVKKIGVSCIKKKNYYEFSGVGINGFKFKNNTIINAGNSGTLARCIMGLLSGTKNTIILEGDKSLSKRDFNRVIEPLNLFGVVIKSSNGNLPLRLKGSDLIRPIKYIEKKGSAQVKTCIILSAVNAPGLTKIKAKKSRNHTELILKHLNYPIKIRKSRGYDLIEIKGREQFKSFNYKVPGDISSASFFIVLTLLAKKSELLIKDININISRLGILKILNRMNANIKIINQRRYKGEMLGDLKIRSSENFKSINCPSSFNSSAIDEFLLIFLIAAKSNGVSRFKNLDELNNKESPRLNIAVNFLRLIGIKVIKKKGNIEIFGNPKLKLNKNYNIKNFIKDHRVFMMSVIAALTLGGKWTINDKDSVNTSFPNFLSVIKKLGGTIN